MPTLPPLLYRRPCRSRKQVSSGPKGNPTSLLPPPSPENARPRAVLGERSRPRPEPHPETEYRDRRGMAPSIVGVFLFPCDSVEDAERRRVNKLSDSGGISPSYRILELLSPARVEHGCFQAWSCGHQEVRTDELSLTPLVQHPSDTAKNVFLRQTGTDEEVLSRCR